MTKPVMLIIFFFIILAILGLIYIFDPGNVTITWLNYEIQFSVIFGFFFLIVILFLLYMFSRIIYALRSFVVHCISYFQRSKEKDEHSQSPPPSLP